MSENNEINFEKIIWYAILLLGIVGYFFYKDKENTNNSKKEIKYLDNSLVIPERFGFLGGLYNYDTIKITPLNLWLITNNKSMNNTINIPTSSIFKIKIGNWLGVNYIEIYFQEGKNEDSFKIYTNDLFLFSETVPFIIRKPIIIETENLGYDLKAKIESMRFSEKIERRKQNPINENDMTCDSFSLQIGALYNGRKLTHKEQKSYYQKGINDPNILLIRRILNEVNLGINLSDSNYIDSSALVFINSLNQKYLKSKFGLIYVSDGITGGVWIRLIFIDKPDIVISAWVLHNRVARFENANWCQEVITKIALEQETMNPLYSF